MEIAKNRLNSLEKTNDFNDTNKTIEWSVKYQVVSSHTSFFAFKKLRMNHQVGCNSGKNNYQFQMIQYVR